MRLIAARPYWIKRYGPKNEPPRGKIAQGFYRAKHANRKQGQSAKYSSLINPALHW